MIWTQEKIAHLNEDFFHVIKHIPQPLATHCGWHNHLINHFTVARLSVGNIDILGSRIIICGGGWSGPQPLLTNVTTPPTYDKQKYLQTLPDVPDCMEMGKVTITPAESCCFAKTRFRLWWEDARGSPWSSANPEHPVINSDSVRNHFSR